MTEPEEPVPAVADTPVATPTVAPVAEDVLKPPPVVELSKDNMADLIQAQQHLVSEALAARDAAQLEYDIHYGVLAKLQMLANQSGKVVLTVIG